jgi:hypothetical protein
VKVDKRLHLLEKASASLGKDETTRDPENVSPVETIKRKTSAKALAVLNQHLPNREVGAGAEHRRV